MRDLRTSRKMIDAAVNQMLRDLCRVNGYDDYPTLASNADGTFSLTREGTSTMTCTVTLTEAGKAIHRRFISTQVPCCPLCGYSDAVATWRREEDGLMHCQRCGGVILDFNPQLNIQDDPPSFRR